MITWLASYPRSGNTLMRLALREMGQRDASLYDDEKTNPSLSSPRLSNPAETNALPDVCFVKTHGLQADTHPCIYILRDGRDALVSLAHYTVDIVGTDKSYSEVLDMLIDGRYQPPYCTWSTHVLYYIKRANLIIRYEAMLENLTRQMARVAMFAGIDLSPLDISFEKLHAANPKFYRRGIVGAWKDEMTEAQHKAFWRYHAEAMEAAGYGAGSGE